MFWYSIGTSLKQKKEKKERNDKVVQLNHFSVALVGRTNGGKSTLFNRLVGRRDALVSKEAGTTRDRREGKGHISGLEFTLIDTGGYVPENKNISLYPAQYLPYCLESSSKSTNKRNTPWKKRMFCSSSSTARSG